MKRHFWPIFLFILLNFTKDACEWRLSLKSKLFCNKVLYHRCVITFDFKLNAREQKCNCFVSASIVCFQRLKVHIWSHAKTFFTIQVKECWLFECAYIYQFINVERKLTQFTRKFNGIPLVSIDLWPTIAWKLYRVYPLKVPNSFFTCTWSGEHFICFHLNGTCFSSFFIVGMWWQLNKWIKALHCNRI